MVIRPLPNETARLKTVVQSAGFRLRFTVHGRKEMAADEIREADVRQVLRWG